MKQTILTIAISVIIALYGCKKENPTQSTPAVPLLLTTGATGITTMSAAISGSVAREGGAPVTEFGISCGTDPDPSKMFKQFVIGGDKNAFTIQWKSLWYGTKYYYCSYAKNSVGYGYGEVKYFYTDSIFKIGDTGPAGGAVFYDKGNNTDGWRYMECAKTDFTSDWGCSSKGAEGTSGAFGSGPANTDTIVKQCGITSAAGKCAKSPGWYLPSVDELKIMRAALGVGAFQHNSYWSSTQYTPGTAFAIRMDDATALPEWFVNGNSWASVRAARKF